MGLDSTYNSENRQIRQGTANNTKGTAFVVFEDVMDAKQACDKLNGFNFQNRYLVGIHHQVNSILENLADDVIFKFYIINPKK